MRRDSKKRIRGVQPTVQQVAKTLRRELTPAERVLWKALRGHQLGGFGFRRQHPVGRFVLDFYAPLYHLVIELDGAGHAEQAERDAERTAYLQAHGYQVLRFHNKEVFQDLPGVLERIQQAAQRIQQKDGEDP